MNSFYHTLSDFYDEIFPLNPSITSFINSFHQESKYPFEVLDIGCATGQLPSALAEKNPLFRITAIEPDEKMIKRAFARNSMSQNPFKLIKASMQDVNELFPDNFFSSIFCMGNTLVHLRNLEEIHRFIGSIYRKLIPGGLFFIQIVNYTRIRVQNITHLPVIETANVTFIRNYEYFQQEKIPQIRFSTHLKFKNDPIPVTEEVFLFPVEYNDLMAIYSDIGFKPVINCGSYEREPFTSDSPALISVVVR